MNIEPKEITIQELTSGYQDNEENGVVGYSGKLDIRPSFQREFVYKDKQRDAVINTVQKGFPLNVMYWALKDDGSFEMLDGQQRTISICQYVISDFSVDGLAFHNLPKDKKKKILDYRLMIYVCIGEESEKLEWFKTINIAGLKLKDQEMRNAVFAGSWVSDAKRYFSKINCVAYGLGSKYVDGEVNRQDYLKTAIDWISEGNIEGYMSKNQHESHAHELWLYFQSVINWVKTIFPVYRSQMKHVEWGFLYNEFKDKKLDPKKLEEQVSKFMQDEDVTNKKGIYTYLLTGDDKHLNIRAFSPNQKREAYERQKGVCIKCGNHFELDAMEADHITPWHLGGKTEASNCQMLCIDDNRRKSGR